MSDVYLPLALQNFQKLIVQANTVNWKATGVNKLCIVWVHLVKKYFNEWVPFNETQKRKIENLQKQNWNIEQDLYELQDEIYYKKLTLIQNHIDNLEAQIVTNKQIELRDQ